MVWESAKISSMKLPPVECLHPIGHTVWYHARYDTHASILSVGLCIRQAIC